MDSPETASAGGFSIRTIIPSMVTLLAFISGLTAIRFALSDRWELAVSAVLIAGVLDGLDGTVARLLRSTSRFGAELDSLSDIVAFGIAPAILLYLWALDSLGRFGWAVATLYAIAMALRLARFNSRLDDEDDKRKRLGYLTGIPAPAGAGLLLSPIMLDHVMPDLQVGSYPVALAVYVAVISLLMISTVPTLALKGLRVPKPYMILLLLLFGAMIAGLFVNAWVVCLSVAVIYIGSMPPVFWSYKRRLRQKSWD